MDTKFREIKDYQHIIKLEQDNNTAKHFSNTYEKDWQLEEIYNLLDKNN